MKNIVFMKMMAIVFVAGFCTSLLGMEVSGDIEIDVTLSVGGKIFYKNDAKSGKRQIFTKNIGNRANPIHVGDEFDGANASEIQQFIIQSQKRKVLFRDLFKENSYETLVGISGAMYQVGKEQQNWCTEEPCTVFEKMSTQINGLGESTPEWNNSSEPLEKKKILRFPYFLPYALVAGLVTEPYLHRYDGIKIKLQLDKDSKERFQVEAELEKEEKEKLEQTRKEKTETVEIKKEDSSWQARLRSAFMPITAFAILAGAGLWMYKKQPNALSDLYAKFNATIVAPLSKYLKGR